MIPIKISDIKFSKECYDARFKVCGAVGVGIWVVDKNKFYKEGKMEKIVVRGWSDLKEYEVTNYPTIKQVKINYGDMDLHFYNGEVEKCVKVLNALGGNFEYKPVEVVDTLEKWEEFQKVISKDGLMFSRDKKMFVSVKIIREGLYITELGPTKIVDVEKKYNVELKILK